MRARVLGLTAGVVCTFLAGAAAVVCLAGSSVLSSGDFRGFPGATETIDGQRTRWTREYSKIEFPLVRWHRVRIELFVHAPATTTCEPQAVLTADDIPLGVVRASQTWTRYEFAIRRPSPLLSPLTLRFSSDALDGSGRGVGVGRIRISPVGLSPADASLMALGGTCALAIWLLFPVADPVRRRLVVALRPVSDHRRAAACLVLACLVMAGVGIRLPHLGDPPLEFHPTRQYRSALIARGYVIDMLSGLSAGEVAAVRAAAASQGVIEPPVFEHAAAILYRVAGREALWIPRLFGVVVWVFGAFGIWYLVSAVNQDRRDAGRAYVAGSVAVALYLLLPFGVSASRAFQPDAIMTALIAASLATLVWHHRHPCRTTLAATVAASALAGFVKPMALFFIVPPAFVLGIGRWGFLSGLRRYATWTVVVAVPAVAWYVYLRLSAPGVLEDRLFLQLLGRRSFWTGWRDMATRVTPWPVLLLAAAGVVMSGRATRRALLAAWVGYLAFGVVFTYHVHTHDYYSLPLIPLVAWSIGALIQAGGDGRSTRGEMTRRVTGLLRGAVVLFALAAIAVAWRRPTYQLGSDAGEATRYERIGRLVNHSSRVVTLDEFYGFGLDYHGRVLARNLPLGADRVVSSLAGRSTAIDASSALAGGEFFVGTAQRELDALPALKNFLAQRCRLVARDGTAERWAYVVYDLRHANDGPR